MNVNFNSVWLGRIKAGIQSIRTQPGFILAESALTLLKATFFAFSRS